MIESVGVGVVWEACAALYLPFYALQEFLWSTAESPFNISLQRFCGVKLQGKILC